MKLSSRNCISYNITLIKTTSIIIIISSLNLSINKMIHFSISSFNLIIRFSITESFVIYYFNAIPRRLIYRFSRITSIFFIAAISRVRSTKRWTSRKYVSFPMCSIVILFLTNLSSYIESKKSRSSGFHLGCSPLLCELSTEFGSPEGSEESCWSEMLRNNPCSAIHCCWKKPVFCYDWSSDVIIESIEFL